MHDANHDRAKREHIRATVESDGSTYTVRIHLPQSPEWFYFMNGIDGDLLSVGRVGRN